MLQLVGIVVMTISAYGLALSVLSGRLWGMGL
jgi:hypothetical protein